MDEMDLDAVMMSQRTLGATSASEPPEVETAPALEHQDHPESGEAGGQPDSVEGTAGAGEGEAPDVAKNNTGEEGESPRYRFPSHGEAERGYKELQARATRAEQELARIKAEAMTAQEKENEAASLAETNRARSANRDAISKAYLETMAKAQELDPEDPEYLNKVADVWAEHHEKVAGYTVARPAGEAERPAETQAEPDPPSPESVWKEAESLARSAGIDEKDLPLFRGQCLSVPSADDAGRPLTLKQQVDMAVKLTREFKGKLTRLPPQSEPLPRSGAPGRVPVNKGDARPLSIDEALHLTTRRLT